MRAFRGVLLLLGAMGCSGHGREPGDHADGTETHPDGLAFAEGPVVVEGEAIAPLARELQVTLTAPASLALTATDGVETFDWVSPTALAHAVPLVGMPAARDWTLTVRAEDGEGGSVEEVVEFRSGDLPDPLPNLDVLVHDAARMQPGLTVIPLFSSPNAGYVAVVDADGRVVWAYGPTSDKYTEVGQLDGHLLVLDNTRIREMDWMGRVLRSWTTRTATEQDIVVDETHFHHEAFVTSRGTLLAFTKTPIDVEDYPQSETDPVPHADSQLANDRVLEIDMETGALIQDWAMTDILDTQRLGYESLSVDETGYEWTHMNACAEDAVNGRWIVSARNQDTVVAFDQTTLEISWILAPHDNWREPWSDKLLTPEGSPFDWSYHQHAVHYDPATGRVLMFDNGNYRASPWTGIPPEESTESHSRLVQYTVDEERMTIRQDFEYRYTPDVFSRAMGDADWLPNGNILGDFALIGWEGGVPMDEFGRGATTVRVVEVEPESGDVVWYLDVWRPREGDASAWQAYRTMRVDRPFAPVAE
jgi:hypothetical protein